MYGLSPHVCFFTLLLFTTTILLILLFAILSSFAYYIKYCPHKAHCDLQNNDNKITVKQELILQRISDFTSVKLLKKHHGLFFAGKLIYHIVAANQ